MHLAGVAELVDALDLGSSILWMWGFKSLHPHHLKAVLNGFFYRYDNLKNYVHDQRKEHRYASKTAKARWA